jgi:hypothetical protein
VLRGGGRRCLCYHTTVMKDGIHVFCILSVAAVVHDEVDIPHSVGETSHQLDISAPLTPVPVVLTLVVVRKRSASCSTAQSCVFLDPDHRQHRG